MLTKTDTIYKNLHVFTLLLMLFISYGILFIGAYYSHPNAEDLSLVVKSKELGLISSIIEVLNTYDGRYFVNFLHGVNPLAWGSLKGYKVAIAFGIIFPVVSLSYFFKSVWQNISLLKALLFSSLFTLVNFALCPSLPHLVYWMVSSFVYLYSWCFWLLWVGSFIRYLKAFASPKKDAYFIITLLILICAMGMNEMFLILHISTLILFVVYFAVNHSKQLKYTLPFLCTGILMFLFFVSNAGIETRYHSFDELRTENHLILSITYLAKHVSILLFDWLSKGLIFLIFLLWSLVFLNEELHENFRSVKIKMKRYYFLIVFIVPFAMLLAFYIPMGEAEVIPYRIFNSFFLVVQFVIILVLLITFGPQISIFIKRKKIAFSLLSFILVCALSLSLLRTPNNLSVLIQEYKSGTLEQYDLTMQKRYSLMKTAEQDQASCWRIAVLPPLENTPRSIFMAPDIKANKLEYFWNNAYEKYFNVDEIRLEGDTFFTQEAIQTILNE